MVHAEPAPVEPPPGAPTACKCPAEPGAEAATDESEAAEGREFDEDPDRRTRLARARKQIARSLATRLKKDLPGHKPACDVALSGPCALRGDFDGDGVRDDVVLVRDGKGAAGLAFVWGKGGTELLGGGLHGPCWTTTEVPDLDGAPAAEPCPVEIEADLDWLARWDLRPRGGGSDGPVLLGRMHGAEVRFPAAGAVGDGVLLDGGDAAAILYRRADGWTLMHLGY